MRSSLQQAMRAQQAVQNMPLARHDHATRQHASAAFRALAARTRPPMSLEVGIRRYFGSFRHLFDFTVVIMALCARAISVPHG